jgi:Putative addiction module component
MAMLTIKQMSWAEKLQAMEELWESLSRDEDRLESPTWHADALEETRQNYAAGREQPLDWDVAKKVLRKRSE